MKIVDYLLKSYSNMHAR